MSKQGFGGDDDKDKNDIERLLDGFKSAKKWYENNQDLFARFTADASALDLSNSEPVSEAHIKDDEVLIVADVSGATSNQLAVKFYKNSLKCELGGRKFTVDVPQDVDEDSLEASMNNGVLRVKLDRENGVSDELEVSDVQSTDETIGDEDEGSLYDDAEVDEPDRLDRLFDDEDVSEIDEDDHKIDSHEDKEEDG
jgi:HSP20 family molecular chaperone IbpA